MQFLQARALVFIYHVHAAAKWQTTAKPQTTLGVQFNPGFLFLCSKAFSRRIFSVILRASNHQFADKKNEN